MPTCLVADKCNTPSLFRMVPAPPGHTLESYRKEGGKLAALAAFAVPMDAPVRADGVARVYDYAGATRVVLPQDKVVMSADEATFLMGRFPGLIEVIDESDGGDAAVSVLMGQRDVLENQLRQVTVERDDVKRQIGSYKLAAETAQTQVSALAIEREALLSDKARLEKELGDTKSSLQELRATDAGAAKLENQQLKAEVDDLKKELARAKSKK